MTWETRFFLIIFSAFFASAVGFAVAGRPIFCTTFLGIGLYYGGVALYEAVRDLTHQAVLDLRAVFNEDTETEG